MLDPTERGMPAGPKVVAAGQGRAGRLFLAEVAARYGLETDPSRTPALIAEHGLTFG